MDMVELSPNDALPQVMGALPNNVIYGSTLVHWHGEQSVEML